MEVPRLRDEGETTFGRRRIAPRVCIVDSKSHIRNFLREALEDLDFIACECETPDALGAVLGEPRPDLFVIGLSSGGLAANAMLEALHRARFDGKILIFGAEGSPMTNAILRVGEELGLDMLPLLPTPFSDNELLLRTAALRQFEPPPNPPVDVAEALHADWLDLWYQPKIDVRSLSLRGCEGLVRLRHPTWGTVPPAFFLPDANDPQFRKLSEFVITRAIRDWRYFFDAYGHIELTINLPLSFLQNQQAVEILASQIPRHPAFEGMIVEFNASEMMRDLPTAARMARQLQLLNIGVAVDNLAEEWPALLDIADFPFVEIKVDRQFVSGCADDRLKQWNCRRILDLADGFGARTVAAGVESRADFVMARELGFDLIQGFFFAKPVEARKFARRILSRHIELPK